MKTHLLLGLAAAALLSSVAVAPAAPLLTPGARVAIIGDSITEQKLYSKYMEAYLLACSGVPDLKVCQYGWGGERADGWAARAVNDLALFKPTVATTCYGMNDGQYRRYAEDIGRAYESNMRRAVAAMQAAGVKAMVLGSPGVVDTKFFRNGNFGAQSAAEGYNQNLGQLRDIVKRIAPELGAQFADVHQPMLDAMAKAKAALGDDYDVGGRDGVHPGPNGHLIMAYAFLRGLGCDGNIAEITLDLGGAPTVSPGHKIKSGSGGKVELESARYPFCFDADPKAAHSTRSILPYVPFNQDLNRFVLKVKGLKTAAATVNWGGESKEFTGEQLAAGVNLAAEFGKTPFDGQFRQVLDAIGKKQNFETQMIKEMVTKFRNFANETKNDPLLAEAFATTGKRLQARQEELDAAVRKVLVPVTHTLSVTAK